MRSRLTNFCIRYSKKVLVGNVVLRPGLEHLQQAAAAHELAGVRVIRRRQDSKVVASARHRLWGDVMLKVCDPVISPHKAYSQLHIDGLVSRASSLLFPKIHSFGLGYTVTELVQGVTLERLARQDLARMPLVGFVDNLHEWALDHDAGHLLTPQETRAIVSSYTERSFRRLRYKSARRAVAASIQLVSRRGAIRPLVGRMSELIPRLSLPKGHMVGDLHPGNVVYAPDSQRLVIVDYEELKRGSVRFDTTYFFVCLLVLHGPSPGIAALAERLFRETDTGCRDETEFFRTFATYMMTVFLIIDGADRALIRRNAELIMGT